MRCIPGLPAASRALLLTICKFWERQNQKLESEKRKNMRKYGIFADFLPYGPPRRPRLPHWVVCAHLPPPPPLPLFMQSSDPCRYGGSCFNSRCTRSHPPGWSACRYGTACKHQGTPRCTRNHPPKRHVDVGSPSVRLCLGVSRGAHTPLRCGRVSGTFALQNGTLVWVRLGNQGLLSSSPISMYLAMSRT